MHKLLNSFSTPYVDAQTLLANMRNYANPREAISKAVKRQDLWRLKNGFFLISSRFTQGISYGDYPYEQIANLLYGPSYVSLEWALSFYSFIPERVSVVTSVTTGSNKEYVSPIGTFNYRHLSLSRYSVGISQKHIEGQLGGFLIASPEKALADWVYFTSQGYSEEELLEDLLESKRIEKESLKSLDIKMMQIISGQYKAKVVKNLTNLLVKL